MKPTKHSDIEQFKQLLRQYCREGEKIQAGANQFMHDLGAMLTQWKGRLPRGHFMAAYKVEGYTKDAVCRAMKIYRNWDAVKDLAAVSSQGDLLISASRADADLKADEEYEEAVLNDWPPCDMFEVVRSLINVEVRKAKGRKPDVRDIEMLRTHGPKFLGRLTHTGRP